MAAKPQTLKEPFKLPMSLEEEDALVHARITNDERPLRRLMKTFHKYTSVAYPPIVEPASLPVEEAREAFLIDLASYHLSLRKSRMVCDAERRQVDGYKQESLRISHEHGVLQNEIEGLKMALEQAQLERRRKIEYDQIAEKINALPTREELQLSISALENDIQVIKDENSAQNRSILARKSTMDAIIADIQKLHVMGKELPKVDADTSRASSEQPEGDTERGASQSGMDIDVAEGTASPSVAGERHDEGELKGGDPALNPTTKPFSPRPSTPLLQTAVLQLRAQNSASGLSNSGITPAISREATPTFTPAGGPDSSPLSPVDPPSPEAQETNPEEGEEGEEVEDIEMGEVTEEKGGAKARKAVEDREEGEASDESSVLSDPPDV